MNRIVNLSLLRRKLPGAALLQRMFPGAILLRQNLPGAALLRRNLAGASILLSNLLLLITVTIISCEPESRDSASDSRQEFTGENSPGEPAERRADGASAERRADGASAERRTDGALLDADVALVTEKPVSHRFLDREVSLYGEQCDYTGREIRSRRYGAVMVHEEGEVLRFNSVESLIGYLDQKADPDNKSAETSPATPVEETAVIGIVDFVSAEHLMMPESLTFHWSRLLPSPGGSFISAMNPDADAELLFNISEAYPGQQYNWQELREHLENN